MISRQAEQIFFPFFLLFQFFAIVIDTSKNKMLTPDIVEKTMLEVFAQYKLYPTIKKALQQKNFDYLHRFLLKKQENGF